MSERNWMGIRRADTGGATADVGVGRRFLRHMLLALIAIGPPAAVAQDRADEALADWQWLREIPVPEAEPAEPAPADADSSAPWIDFLITPDVFSEASPNLDDLRVHTASGQEVPYALRIRREQWGTEEVPAEVFNRSVGPEEAQELSLDLAATTIQHNEVEVLLPGENFRRRATLEGSPDGESWRMLAEDFLLRFVRGDDKIEHLHLSYPPSRFRFLRLRVYPDPVVDEEPIEIERVHVRRRVAVPGEDLVQRASMGPREPTRQSGAPASAWILGLGGEHVPVERIEVETSESDFVRDYIVEYAGAPGPRVHFQQIAAGTWRRRQGEEPQPLVAEFNEVRAARLRLIVIDHSNPPLNVQSVNFAAPARQVVLSRPEPATEGLRLFYGNPEAIAPRYDFARNLPDRLNPPPTRAELGPPQANPAFVPAPVPVTERWPAMIYLVLMLVSVVLGAVIISVARTTIAWHDGDTGGAPEAPAA